MLIDVNDYLLQLSKKLITSKDHKEKIQTSIDYLKTKVWGAFQNKLHDVRVFGSYDRGTEVPFHINPHTDVDIMVVFRENEFQPKTYLNQLRSFSDKIYSRSDVYPDHPSIVVELNHIRFDLVPAINNNRSRSETAVKIPGTPSKDLTWIESDPGEFKKRLISKNSKEQEMTIPLVKILKYWNYINERPFNPFTLEYVAVDESYSGRDLKGDLYNFIKEFNRYKMEKREQEIYDNLVSRCQRLQHLETGGMAEYIIQELESFLPMPKYNY